MRAFNYRVAPKILGVFSDRLHTNEGGNFLYMFNEQYSINSRIYASGQQRIVEKINPDNHHLIKLKENGRAWILFSQAERQAEEHLTGIFQKRGIEIDHKTSKGADLYLYNLN